MASASCQHDEHRVHLVMYHLIFCPKRRKKVLVGDIGRDLDTLIREKCAEQKWIVHELAIMPDHVHLFVQVNPVVQVNPDDSASETTRQIKGYTSRVLRLRHPELLKLPSLWTRSFFAASAGNVSKETIQRYIAAQKGM